MAAVILLLCTLLVWGNLEGGRHIADYSGCAGGSYRERRKGRKLYSVEDDSRGEHPMKGLRPNCLEGTGKEEGDGSMG